MAAACREILDAPQPYVELPVSLINNRKPAQQPLRPELVAILRMHLQDLKPTDFVLRGKVPSVAKLRIDLTAAGIPWVDERGRVLDVHALRTTFGTMFSAAGITPRVALELMRHSDIKLTTRISTDAAQLPLAADMQRLPAYDLPENSTVKRTQTGVSGCPELSQRGVIDSLIRAAQVPVEGGLVIKSGRLTP